MLSFFFRLQVLTPEKAKMKHTKNEHFELGDAWMSRWKLGSMVIGSMG